MNFCKRVNPVDLEMAFRLSQIEYQHRGKIVYLPPSLHLDCGRLVHTVRWYKHAGFKQTKQLNYWRIPKNY